MFLCLAHFGPDERERGVLRLIVRDYCRLRRFEINVEGGYLEDLWIARGDL